MKTDTHKRRQGSLAPQSAGEAASASKRQLCIERVAAAPRNPLFGNLKDQLEDLGQALRKDDANVAHALEHGEFGVLNAAAHEGCAESHRRGIFGTYEE